VTIRDPVVPVCHGPSTDRGAGPVWSRTPSVMALQSAATRDRSAGGHGKTDAGDERTAGLRDGHPCPDRGPRQHPIVPSLRGGWSCPAGIRWNRLGGLSGERFALAEVAGGGDLPVEGRRAGGQADRAARVALLPGDRGAGPGRRDRLGRRCSGRCRGRFCTVRVGRRAGDTLARSRAPR
jgi:hypothetical protein